MSENLLPVEITVPEDFEGDNVEVGALAWNVCEQICIPGEQRLSIKLPVGNFLEYNANSANLFADAQGEFYLPLTMILNP